MKKTMILFVMMMVVVNVMAQDAFDFGFTNTRVSQPRTVTVPTTTTRPVSVNALAQASARRNSSRYAATTATQQTSTTDNTTQQMVNQAQANQMQRVISGKVENVYVMGDNIIKLTISPTRGTFGQREQDFFLVNYTSNVDICRNDLITFVANYDQAYDRPAIYNNQVINPAGMQRIYSERIAYYGDATAMYNAYPQMTKWGTIINNVMAGAMTVASIVSLVKAIF